MQCCLLHPYLKPALKCGVSQKPVRFLNIKNIVLNPLQNILCSMTMQSDAFKVFEHFMIMCWIVLSALSEGYNQTEMPKVPCSIESSYPSIPMLLTIKIIFLSWVTYNRSVSLQFKVYCLHPFLSKQTLKYVSFRICKMFKGTFPAHKDTKRYAY